MGFNCLLLNWIKKKVNFFSPFLGVGWQDGHRFCWTDPSPRLLCFVLPRLTRMISCFWMLASISKQTLGTLRLFFHLSFLPWNLAAVLELAKRSWCNLSWKQKSSSFQKLNESHLYNRIQSSPGSLFFKWRTRRKTTTRRADIHSSSSSHLNPEGVGSLM